MENEIWKDIDGYESKYLISSLGNVYSKNINRNLSPGDNGKGYLFVNLRLNKKIKSFYIHRLVAMHFIDNPESKNQVNHKDCVKSNNKLENLEWCNNLENMKHASINKRLYTSDYQKRQTSIANSGQKSHLTKLSNEDVIKIKSHLANGIKTQKEIGLLFNITRSNISAIKRGKSWKNL